MGDWPHGIPAIVYDLDRDRFELCFPRVRYVLDPDDTEELKYSIAEAEKHRDRFLFAQRQKEAHGGQH